eukprot:74482-Alexandrium_andersonii.AAC.1
MTRPTSGGRRTRRGRGARPRPGTASRTRMGSTALGRTRSPRVGFRPGCDPAPGRWARTCE